MSTYAFRDASGDLVASYPEFARPIPVHAQTPGALAAVESVRELGRRTRLERVVAGLVTDHGNPPDVEPYVVAEYRVTKKGKRKATGRMIDGDVVTAAARSMRTLAVAHGFDVKLETLPDRCVVSGFRPDCGFSAEWVRGRAGIATWHEPRVRYALIDDPRPEPKKSERDKVSLANRRPVGVPKVHLTIVGSPAGVKIGVTAVTERIKACQT